MIVFLLPESRREEWNTLAHCALWARFSVAAPFRKGTIHTTRPSVWRRPVAYPPTSQANFALCSRGAQRRANDNDNDYYTDRKRDLCENELFPSSLLIMCIWKSCAPEKLLLCKLCKWLVVSELRLGTDVRVYCELESTLSGASSDSSDDDR